MGLINKKPYIIRYSSSVSKRGADPLPKYFPLSLSKERGNLAGP